MTDCFDVVIAGAGHNALVLGSYLAKAGLSVCIAERRDKVGGSVATAETTGPGFKQDICSLAHNLLMGNPMMRGDELALFSKFGLRYAQPEKLTALAFDDGTVLEFWSDLNRTCASMARISAKDADNFRKFCTQVDQILDMILLGMYSVPPSAGTQTVMMDQTPEGQEMLRLQAISAWDLICEWIEHPKIRIALARYASESMLNPFDNGTGFGFYIILPHMYRFGAGVCIGGSGAFAEALEQCFKAHGGTVRVNAEVKQILIESGEAKGIVLTDGKIIRANKAVVGGLHVAQIFPHMLPGIELPAGFQHRIDTLKYSDFQAMNVHVSLKEPLKFRAGSGIDDFFWIERCHSDLDEFRDGFQDLKKGLPNRSYAVWIQQFRVDPSRTPAGMGSVHIHAFMPLDLKDGGREKWDEIGEEVAQGFINDLREQCTNLTDDNIIQMHFKTPLDITRYNNALVNGDIVHIGFYSWQMGGNRPVPGWSQYRMPVPKLYMTGGSTHPGGGVTGGPGRNAAQVIMEDLGIDFEKACG
jgi:phytoene dehydrogenase-like protein